MMKKKSSKSKWVGLTLAAAMSGSAAASMQVDSRGGLSVYDPADSKYWFTIGGLLQVDEVIFSGNKRAKRNDFPNGANLRRTWLDFNGGVGEFWTYRLELDFRGEPVVLRNAYLNFAGIECSNIAVGQFQIPFGLENWGNKQDLLFLEQSLMGTAFLAPEFGIGLYADTNFADMVTIAAAVFEPRQVANSFGSIRSRSFNQQLARTTYSPKNDRLGEAVRVTFSPCHTDDVVYHLGASARHQKLISTAADGSVVLTNLFQTAPEAIARSTALLVNAGAMRAKQYTVGGLEAAAMWGPAMVQAEYERAKVKTVAVANSADRFFSKGHPSFRGYHVQGAYVITGESHSYDFPSGTFGSVKPASDCGAWEVAARYSFINLNSKKIHGGSEHNLTLGLNWYATDNVKVVFNYIRANIHPTNTNITQDRVSANKLHMNALGGVGTAGRQPSSVDAKKRKLNIFGLRFQVAI